MRVRLRRRNKAKDEKRPVAVPPPEAPDASWFEKRIFWRRSGDVYAPWRATHDGMALKLWLGDFPAEPFYTLLVEGDPVLSLDSPWPRCWIRTLELREVNDGGDHRSLCAYLNEAGDFVLDAHDLGPMVEQILGEGIREYEWMRTIPGGEVRRLLTALGVTGDAGVLDALEAWLETHAPEDLEGLIEEQGISSTFWSRVGD